MATDRAKQRASNPEANEGFLDFEAEQDTSFGEVEEDWGIWWDVYFAGYKTGYLVRGAEDR